MADTSDNCSSLGRGVLPGQVAQFCQADLDTFLPGRPRGSACGDTIGTWPTEPTPTSSVKASSRSSRGRSLQGLVNAYFNPNRGFARATFDGLDADSLLTHNPRDCFTVDDIVATSLLDVPSSFFSLLGQPRSAPFELPKVEGRWGGPCPGSLWEADERTLAAATTLWRVLRDIDAVGRTRASKLMARKRPQLIPIVDSVIAGALHSGDVTAVHWRIF